MASPNISFTQIPSNVRVPGGYFEENTSNALTGLTGLNATIVLLAQGLSTGSVAANTPTKVFSESDAQLYFGTGSIAHLATKEIFQCNPYADLTVCSLADANGATKATASIVFSGTVSQAGVTQVYVGDVGITVPIATTDSSSSIATNVVTALNQVQQQIPFTYTSTGGTINFTARNGGTIGNSTAFTASTTSGVTIVVTQPSNGATDPNYGSYSTPGTTLAAIVGGGYTIIASTLVDSVNLASLKAMVAFTSGPIEQRPAIYVAGYTDRIGSLASAKSIASGLNDGRATIAYITYTSGNNAKSENWKAAAAYAADLATATDPAVPYDGDTLISLAAPAVIDRFTYTSKQDLLINGLTPLQVSPGEVVTVCRAVTTYTVNTLGVPDPTLLDITTIRTLDYVREQIRERLTTKFRKQKLNDALISIVRAEVLDVLSLLETLAIVQNVKQYASGVICERDTQNIGQLDIKVPSNIVPGLHVIAGVINLILS